VCTQSIVHKTCAQVSLWVYCEHTYATHMNMASQVPLDALWSIRAPATCTQDPPWVYDKAYYKVSYKLDSQGNLKWVPEKIKLDTLIWSSLFPTKKQLGQFERSPAFLDMIYQVSLCIRRVRF